MLALFSSVEHGQKPDGVRALKRGEFIAAVFAAFMRFREPRGVTVRRTRLVIPHGFEEVQMEAARWFTEGVRPWRVS